VVLGCGAGYSSCRWKVTYTVIFDHGNIIGKEKSEEIQEPKNGKVAIG
jgi:hypothetical protein